MTGNGSIRDCRICMHYGGDIFTETKPSGMIGKMNIVSGGQLTELFPVRCKLNGIVIFAKKGVYPICQLYELKEALQEAQR